MSLSSFLGCTKPGDVVRNPEANSPNCGYNLCILANENKNLWKKPALELSPVICPLGRGLMADFCNQNTLLLRAAALLHTGKHSRDAEHEKAHQPYYINAVDQVGAKMGKATQAVYWGCTVKTGRTEVLEYSHDLLDWAQRMGSATSS